VEASTAVAGAEPVAADEPAPPPAQPARGARIVTYDFDPEGDDLSVPRTQIAAHAVTLAEPVDPLLVVLADAYSPRADAYRTMRRKLSTTNPNARVLAVTSASPGEGKTVFAVNLALTLRESARTRVLLIEANVRAPIMGKLLGFDPPECFLAQLKRHAEDPRAPWVVAEPLPKLHVMAIDAALPRDPLLDQMGFSMGMERLKQAGYEYVVVDSPPVLGGLDCNVISDAVDGVILTALPMKSMRRQMRKAVQQLEPAPILGVVVLEA
jgi:Mrp family chromosome partitioning ATPase